MTARYRLTASAQSDLRSIAGYSRRVWGVDQARAYITALREVFRKLADRPGVGRLRDELHAGLRSFSCGQHAVFYVIDGGGVIVVRILHQRMDVARHISAEEVRDAARRAAPSKRDDKRD